MVTRDLEHELFSGGGELGGLMRGIDWSQTSLGPADRWSPSLRTMVKVLLANRFPLLLWWGPDQHQLYNDAYRPVLGSKHPRSLGQPARECWPEIWHIIEPLILSPYSGGPSTWDDDLSLEVNRHGFVEETHFTVAYSPVPDDSVPGGIGGVLATVHETTRQVIDDRRMALLRDLSARSAEAKTAEEACQFAAESLAQYPQDVPFALLYLLNADQTQARLAGLAGIARDSAICPETIDLSDSAASVAWPLLDLTNPGVSRLVEDLGQRASAPATRALVVRIPTNLQQRLAGFLVLGISPKLEFDERYHRFFELAASQVAASIGNAQAFDSERRRAEALAELDIVKTAFFNNVSHEFRTPLTLLLGPLEEVLRKSTDLSESQQGQLEVAHRNALRLLRLVNTLLDFSRIEAGRIEAAYAPTDLATYTADLVSSFRSAVEQAGMRLVVECDPLPGPVYVDRDMWEKIVLNLVSNAFKFTFDGEIRIGLQLTPDGNRVELRVHDTGVGIAAQDLPHLFERFHRVPGTRARTHEGSGIGLALVQELARLHGGSVRVTSAPGQGSTFLVSIPTGTDHLPAAQVTTTQAARPVPNAAAPYIEEALRWLPEQPGDSDGTSGGTEAGSERGRILIVDDNADMRQYVAHLLQPMYTVEVARDGVAALDVIAGHPPDLVVADIMMPRLDGVGLLHALRTSAQTRDIPVILLSARAGEEAKVLGLESGADDYLVKPFVAAELLARVATHLRLARARAVAAQTEREVGERAVRARDVFFSVAAHELRTPVATIKATAQLALRRHARSQLDPAQFDMMLRSIVDVTDRLAGLTSDLLDVSRVQSGLLELRRAPTDVVQLVSSCIERARLLDDAHFVDCRAPAEPISMDLDATRIEQVLDNALTNAIKYSPPGTTVEVGVDADTSGVSISVTDQGIGLLPGVAETMFEPFRRAENVVAQQVPGLGLGLFISRRIVELHGGRIWAESQGEGLGTTLHIWLPQPARPPGPAR